MRPARDLDDALNEFERNPLGLSEKDLGESRERDRRYHRTVNSVIGLGVAFAAGYAFARSSWAEILWGLGGIGLLLSIVLWQTRRDWA